MTSAAGRRLSAALLIGSCLLGSSLRAQAPVPPPVPPVPEENAPPKLPQEALNQLLAPIALYPDALIALILPASTVPSDLVLAARYISSSGDLAQVVNQPWDESVKSLARYPDVVKWMDQNLEWTTQVGDAFLNQPADVMNTIQQLRAQAIAAGTLVDCPQQRIVKEESCIRIVPAEPDVIYVPQYDPEIVYAQPYEPYGAYVGPALTFGIGFAVGSWLNYDCDWPRRRVCVGDWNPRWRDDWYPGWKNGWNPGWKRKWKGRGGGDYAVNVVNITSESARAWQPSERIRRQSRQRNFESNTTALNSNGRRGGAGNSVQRIATVARPSLLNVADQGGGPGRRGGRRSDSDPANFSRNLPGDPGTLSGSQSIQGEQSSRGNGDREGKGKGRGREQSDSRSGAIANQSAEPASVGGNQGKGDNFKDRKGGAESGAVASSSSRSKSSGSVRSKSKDSSQQFKTGRSKSSQSGNSAQSFSKASKHSQDAGGGAKGGSKRHATAPKQDKAQFAGGGNKGGSKSGQKGDKGKGKGKD
jgi:hypothetical protein